MQHVRLRLARANSLSTLTVDGRTIEEDGLHVIHLPLQPGTVTRLHSLRVGPEPDRGRSRGLRSRRIVGDGVGVDVGAAVVGGAVVAVAVSGAGVVAGGIIADSGPTTSPALPFAGISWTL